jgi:hypothetical protein
MVLGVVLADKLGVPAGKVAEMSGALALEMKVAVSSLGGFVLDKIDGFVVLAFVGPETHKGESDKSHQLAKDQYVARKTGGLIVEEIALGFVGTAKWVELRMAIVGVSFLQFVR